MRIGWARLSSEWDRTAATNYTIACGHAGKKAGELNPTDFNPLHVDDDDEDDE